MRQILGDHGFAETIGADDHDVLSLPHEGKGEEVVEQLTIDLLGPVVVEVSHRLESAQARVIEPSLEAASQPLSLFDLDDLQEPGLGANLLEASQQTQELETLQTLLDC